MTIGKTETDYYVLDAYQERLEFPDLLVQAKRIFHEQNASALAIEKKVSGHSLFQMLRRYTNLPVVVLVPRGDKVARANLIAPICESKKVLLHRFKSAELLDNLLRFPFGANDDFTDAFVGALTYLARPAEMNNNNIPPMTSFMGR